MPPRHHWMLVAIVAMSLCFATSAYAIDPSNERQSIVSANFDSSDGGFVRAPIDIGGAYPSMAYWGRITGVRRGTTGQSMWCAGTARYPAPTVSTYFPLYPKIATYADRKDETVILSGTTAVALAYQGTSTIEVWSGPNKTGTKYVKDTHYTVATNVAGFTTVARKGTVIPSGGTVYVTYKFRTSGTAGKMTLGLPQLANYYRSWVSYYYYMPSLGTNDIFALHWVDAADPNGSKESIYGSALPKNTSWVRKEHELSSGNTVSLSRQAGSLYFQFVDISPGAGGVANGQGPAVDDVVISGYKYGPIPSSSIQLQSGGGDPVASAGYQDSYMGTSDVRLSGSDQGQVKLVWSKPPRSLGSVTPDERTMAYRVWRKSGTQWDEITSPQDRTPVAEIADALTGSGTVQYAVQAWDTSTGSGRGQYTAKTLTIPAPSSGGGSIVKVEYQVDGGSVVTKTGTYHDLKLPPKDGAYSVRFRVQDNEGNWSEYKTISFKVLASTSFTGLSGDRKPSYGRSSYVSATLRSGTSAVAGQKVTLQRLSNRTSGSWVNVGTKATSSSGYVKFDIPANSSGYNYTKTVYRLAFSASGQYASATPTASRTILPKASLGKPWASSKTIKKGKSYTWYSSIKPRHTKGSKSVKLQFQRYKSGKWRAYKTVSATAYNYSSYSRVKLKIKLPYKGTWRVRAVHSDTGHAKSYSSWYKFKVK